MARRTDVEEFEDGEKSLRSASSKRGVTRGRRGIVADTGSGSGLATLSDLADVERKRDRMFWGGWMKGLG